MKLSQKKKLFFQFFAAFLKSTLRFNVLKKRMTIIDFLLPESASQHLYHINCSVPSKLSRKKSVLLTRQILGLHVQTLAADNKYLVLNRDI